MEQGKAEPRVTETVLYAAVVAGGFKNTADDCHAWRRSAEHYAFKVRSKLTGFIDDVWSWETVDDSLSSLPMTRPALLQQFATMVRPL